MPDVRLIPTKDLPEMVRAAYEQHMLYEVNGAQYSTMDGAQAASNARTRYYQLDAELQRRQRLGYDMPTVNRLTGEDMNHD